MSGVLDWADFARHVLKLPDSQVAQVVEFGSLIERRFRDLDIQEEMRAWDLYAAATIAMSTSFTGDVDEVPSQAAIMADRMMAERQKRTARLVAARAGKS